MAMHRTQVFLEPEQHAALHRQARQEGRTVSEIVREYVDLGLARRRASRPPARELHRRAA
jgi:hypothetical protein